MITAYDAAKGVRVNAVNLGLTLTERLHEGMQAEARQQGISTEEAVKPSQSHSPLGRIVESNEIAGAVVAMDGAVTPMVFWGTRSSTGVTHSGKSKKRLLTAGVSKKSVRPAQYTSSTMYVPSPDGSDDASADLAP